MQQVTVPSSYEYKSTYTMEHSTE